MNNAWQQEIHYRLLKLLAEEPQIGQREMAKKMGISVGVTNYCIGELTKKGLIKIHRFRSAKNKIPYTYNLTPRGIEEKGRMAVKFLKRKIEEYEEIKRQIALLSRELEENGLQELVSAEPKEAAATTA
jgi:EPS-associated MarR family transcriptional regulator